MSGSPAKRKSIRTRVLHALGPGRELTALISRFRDAVRLGRADAADAGAELYSRLFGSLRPSVTAKSRWLLVLDDALFGAPLAAAVITTSLSPGTAHVAQIVVDPSSRRAGLARLLLERACEAARRLGHGRMSLIVSGANLPARSLYDRCGFVETARFLYASRPALMRQPTIARLARTAPAATTA